MRYNGLPMNNYALLTLLRGKGYYGGLPEISFHYPPQAEGKKNYLHKR